MKECSEQLEKSAVSEQEKLLQVKVDKLQNKVLGLRNHLKNRKSHCNYLRLRLGMSVKCVYVATVVCILCGLLCVLSTIVCTIVFTVVWTIVWTVVYLCLLTGYVLAEVRLYKKLKTDLEGKVRHITCVWLLMYRLM